VLSIFEDTKTRYEWERGKKFSVKKRFVNNLKTVQSES
jgi:hypothetical protein